MSPVPALHAESSGNGPPLVFWHGWAANLRVFDGLRAALAGHWRTMAIDLPGHGRSPWVEGTEAADPEWIAGQTVAALLAQMPARATLIAWSLAGQPASIRVPTLVIAGQYDRVTAPGARAALAAMLPQAQHLEIPRAGHAPFLSHLERLLPELRSFLGGSSAARPAA